MNFKQIFDLSENKKSLGNRFRAKRFDYFLKKIQKLDKPLHILDLGGKINFWENRGLAGNNNYHITLLNIEIEKSEYSNIKSIIGTATDLSKFKDNSVDLVHSNSVIEHLHNFENQKKMAKEVIRVGKKHIIQTPNKYFFLINFFINIQIKNGFLCLTRYNHQALSLGNNKSLIKRFKRESRLSAHSCQLTEGLKLKGPLGPSLDSPKHITNLYFSIFAMHKIPNQSIDDGLSSVESHNKKSL